MKNEEIIKRLESCNYALEDAAYYFKDKKLKDLPAGIIESTCPADICLIEVRENLEMIKELQIGELNEKNKKDYIS